MLNFVNHLFCISFLPIFVYHLKTKEMENYKCSCCDSKKNVSLRDLGFDEYIPMCIDCFVEWSNIQKHIELENDL